MDQVIYIDANILIPILWDRDPELEPVCRDLIRRLKGDVRSQPDRKVKIPKLTVGEIMNRYIVDMLPRSRTDSIERYNTTFMAELFDVIDGLEAELSSIQTQCWKVVQKLKREDRELGYNDLYLAGMAICDNYSTHLIARDSDLVETRALKKVASNRSQREYGFKIVQDWRSV